LTARTREVFGLFAERVLAFDGAAAARYPGIVA
jgi:hypothetical protein